MSVFVIYSTKSVKIVFATGRCMLEVCCTPEVPDTHQITTIRVLQLGVILIKSSVC